MAFLYGTILNTLRHKFVLGLWPHHPRAIQLRNLFEKGKVGLRLFLFPTLTVIMKYVGCAYASSTVHLCRGCCRVADTAIAGSLEGSGRVSRTFARDVGMVESCAMFISHAAFVRSFAYASAEIVENLQGQLPV